MDFFQALLKELVFRVAKQANLAQHLSMGHRSQNIVRSQQKIEFRIFTNRELFYFFFAGRIFLPKFHSPGDYLLEEA